MFTKTIPLIAFCVGISTVAIEAGHQFSADGSKTSSQRQLQTGKANGTLVVGSFKTNLAYAYAFPEKESADAPTEQYRVFLTNRPMPAAALKFAVTAGADEGDRQQLAVEMAGAKLFGVEAIIAADKRILRVNVYSPDSTLGMMLLSPSRFQDTSFDSQRIAGRLGTEKAQPDARLRKTVHYDVTFAAEIRRAPQ